MLILPFSYLKNHKACNLPDRVMAFTRHHGRAPDETTPLRDWLAVSPNVADWLWVAGCLGEPGRRLAVTVAVRAGCRLPPTCGPCLEALQPSLRTVFIRGGEVTPYVAALDQASLPEAVHCARLITGAVAFEAAASCAFIAPALPAVVERDRQKADFLEILTTIEADLGGV